MGKSKITPLLLTVSLALNLAFLAAFLYKKLRHQPPPPQPQVEFKSDFGLTGAQDATVREIVRKFKINSILYKEDILEKRVQIIEELGNPMGERDKINQRTEELNQLENQLNRDFIAALLKISDVLEPKQRLNMVYRLSRNWFFFNHRQE